jgi:hypothetical protein
MLGLFLFRMSRSPRIDATVVTLDAGDILADAISQVAPDPLDFPLLKKNRGVAWDLKLSWWWHSPCRQGAGARRSRASLTSWPNPLSAISRR